MKLTNISLLIVIALTLSACAEDKYPHSSQKSTVSRNDASSYQVKAGEDILDNISGRQPRNIILCIGDGLGFNHVALARNAEVGRFGKLNMERLPVLGVVRTHAANSLITDSAAAGTAMACGVKTNNGMIGMTPDKTEYSSILELLQKKGWRTGLVATSEISHATPASFASHAFSRDNQRQIVKQLFENRIDVLLGGGRELWNDSLLEKAAAEGYQVIETREQMLKLKPAPVIGLFADGGMTTVEPEPTLTDMTQTAIKLLSSPGEEWFSPESKFFLMVEGSQIDWASHDNETEDVIRQTLLFDMAVKKVIEFAQEDKQTLVIVTADHETGGLMLKTGMLNEQKMSADWTSGDHTAADVPLYAFGPGSEKFAGVMDNTEIPIRIAELMDIEEFPLRRAKSKVTEKVSSK